MKVYKIPCGNANTLYRDDKYMERTESAYHMAISQGRTQDAEKLLYLYQSYVSDTYVN